MSYPDTIADVEQVEIIGLHQLRLTFDDGLVREIDFEDQLRGRIFGPLRDPSRFAEVQIEDGTIAWPGGADFDPIILHGDEEPGNGPPLRVLRESHLRAA